MRREDFENLPIGTMVWLDGVRYGVSAVSAGVQPGEFCGVEIPATPRTPVFVRNVFEAQAKKLTRFNDQEIARLSFWPPPPKKPLHPRLRRKEMNFQDQLFSQALKGK